jgi:dTDP-4-dehydrorhamnose reductase
MRYLIAGGQGMLGRDLARALDGREVTALGRAELDITDEAAVRRAVPGHDVVINAAAYTRVDDAETNEDEAFAINATGAANLAAASADAGARFVQVSTDYVFDGAATSPYPEDAPRDPQGAYGRTKAEGERLVLESHPEAHIVRTAWLYGAHGPNFARTMLRLAGQRDTLSVVADQVGQPSWTLDVANSIVRLLDAELPAGIYHGTNSGQASWFEFARAIFAVSGLDPERVNPIDSASYPLPAPRPAYSVLGHDAWRRARIAEPRDWREALSAAAADGALSGT